MKFSNKIRLALSLVVLLTAAAFAARTTVTPVVPKGPYPGTVNAGDLAFTFAAADTVNLNQFAASGTEVLIVQNTDVASQTITFTSRPDAYGRSADVGPYTLATGTFAVFNFRNANQGWVQADGNVYFQASTATVKFVVLRVP
jgi:hypothetical protein